MMNKKPVPAEKLCAILPAKRIPYAGSEQIPKSKKTPVPQARALEALELALSINDSGYNIYLAGGENLGRSYMLKDFLKPKAKQRPTPPDLAYVHNFIDKDAPDLLYLPPGQGRKLKTALNQAINRIRKELPLHLERDSYNKLRSRLINSFQIEKNILFERMDKEADSQGFRIDLDENGSMSLYPVLNGKRLSEQEFEKLNPNERNSLKKKGDSLARVMSNFLRKIGKMEQELLNNEHSLEQEAASELLTGVLDPLAQKFSAVCNGNLPEDYFQNIKKDILEHLDYFLPSDPLPQVNSQTPYHQGNQDGPMFNEIAHRYSVNLLVDNSQTHGAPVIFEDNPTAANLLGCIERESEMGALITNFTLIKGGALHRANGGFLVMQMEDVAQHPQAWEGLLRALRSRQIKMDDSGEGDGIKTKGLQPDPLKLDLKVILIGNEDLYETLFLNDSRFSKLFKIKAHMTNHMPRNAKGIKIYLQQMRRIIDEAGLLHFDQAALAGLVDFGSLLLEDQKYLSLEFPLLREVMLESSALAKMQASNKVTAEHLQKAMQAREFRLNLVEEAFMEEYDRKLIKVNTSGQGIGQVNGLSVTAYGDFEFGLPHQISCTIGVGHGGIVDLEREAQLGGPIHTKAIMILKSYLVSLFARKKPLILTGSICFEQSYAGIEGDSASGAELAALLSALAEVPISLSFAFTGALGQSGQIMAVGSVNRKVEGFFEVCRRHGLSGAQGVIIPKDNLEHLMLRKEILQAVEDNKFYIYAVEHISEAMEILTGIKCGVLRKDGTFTPGSLYKKVDRKLTELTRLALKNGKTKSM